ncbi:hypothetical protein ACKS0A_06243 [Histoplasma ohiense]
MCEAIENIIAPENTTINHSSSSYRNEAENQNGSLDGNIENIHDVERAPRKQSGDTSREELIHKTTPEDSAGARGQFAIIVNFVVWLFLKLVTVAWSGQSSSTFWGAAVASQGGGIPFTALAAVARPAVLMVRRRGI